MTKSRKNIVQNENEKSLLDFPDEILLNIPAQCSGNVSVEVMGSLSKTCHTLHNLFQPDLDILPAKTLCQHVVNGEKKEAEEILEKNPGLLLVKAPVIDEAGRKIVGTAFQIALGAKDVSLFPDKFPEMVEMIAAYFKKIPDGEKEKQQQYAEQFPQGFEKLEAERQAQDSAALHTVFAAITNASTIAVAEEAVTVFQDYLKKQTESMIRTGYHFNEALFEEALTLYNNNFDACGGYFSKKNDLAAVKVLGGIQRYFTANLAQIFCDGFIKVVDEKRALSRSKLLDKNIPSLFSAKNSFFSAKLGIAHFVYSFYDTAGKAPTTHLSRLFPDFKSYVEQKQQFYKTYATTVTSSIAPV